MDFKDISARMKKVKGDQQTTPKAFDHVESYRLRGKMLGVLIRDARVNSSRTIEDCARLLQVEPSTVESWEYGDELPSLPQLELLAYYLDVHISHFWGQTILTDDQQDRVNTQEQFMVLRHRMIGGLLHQAREETNQTVDTVAAATLIDSDLIAQYELGMIPIPMPELTVLAGQVNKNMSYFLESDSYIGELLRIREEWKHFIDLDEEARVFAANPLNIGFIRIAMMFSHMPVEQLRQVAEGMLEITM